MEGPGGTTSSGGSGGSGVPWVDCGGQGVNAWIASSFAGAPVMTGDFTARTNVETPRLVKDATGTNAKYAFFLREQESPDDRRAAFVNVNIHDLKSSDAWGAGIATSDSHPDMKLYLSNVYIEPNWPTWKNYDTTNYDGIVLDSSDEFYAQCLTIKNWNADSALDIKANKAQFDRLTTIGNGNRTLRFWRTGPHYLVESSVENGTGALIWIKDCPGTTLYVYESTFNGASQIPANKISCDDGANPNVVYLTEDPRTTGEMHPMFSAN
jgi:hypothetical protein